MKKFMGRFVTTCAAAAVLMAVAPVAPAHALTMRIIGLGEEGCGVIKGFYSVDSGICYKRIAG